MKKGDMGHLCRKRFYGNGNAKRMMLVILSLIVSMLSVWPAYATELERIETPNYKVAFYPFDCYHMQDENGRRTGYGYEMMQGVANFMQCTFSYVGYDKSAKECEEMLKNGELDIYTAAKHTPERDEEFAFTNHPAITSYTCMNVKVGNRKIIAGDYATYDGIRVGLLQRHTYNDMFLSFAKEKGFHCEVFYYNTPTELTEALVTNEVDALVNSYINIPDDEQIIENFGETPYFIMGRKEDQELIDQIDEAIDCMNVQKPSWRSQLYNKYYGAESFNANLTEEEEAVLQKMHEKNTVIRAVMNPDDAPYSYFENGVPKGIAFELFAKTAEKLQLEYKIVQTADRKAYFKAVQSGDCDIVIDMDDFAEDAIAENYKMTDPYVTTPVSMLRCRGATEKIRRIAILEDNIATRDILLQIWPKAQVTVANSPKECRNLVLKGEVDGALLKSYMAQKLASDEIQNRLRAEIVPGALMQLSMGIYAQNSVDFYHIWEKTLTEVSAEISADVVQNYIEESATPSMLGYMYDHPMLILIALIFAFAFVVIILMYWQSVKNKNRQEKIAGELAVALRHAREATELKQNFFSKMSHDIRTPLNVVLGMTQIARKYKKNASKLEHALDTISTEGNYLLLLVNSILDVNQLEYGVVDLAKEPFNPADSLRECAEILQTLADKKELHLTVTYDELNRVVLGDERRLEQILINIVSNAIKYTNEGGHIELKLECLPEHWYRFSCKDDGIGMSEEFIRHICEDYTRAEDSRVSKTQGTGLGMSVVKGFTEIMGGILKIESQLKKGSTFIVEIPFPDASEEERQKVLHPVSDDEIEKEKYIGKKVLLVEDNVLNAEIAMELLQSIGLIVEWADNGQAGVTLFENSRPDEYYAVFMDMQMPVMNGVEATRRIRASSRRDSDIPVFAMTANTFSSDWEKCREAGMNGYIPKPVNIKYIKEVLRKEL